MHSNVQVSNEILRMSRQLFLKCQVFSSICPKNPSHLKWSAKIFYILYKPKSLNMSFNVKLPVLLFSGFSKKASVFYRDFSNIPNMFTIFVNPYCFCTMFMKSLRLWWVSEKSASILHGVYIKKPEVCKF